MEAGATDEQYRPQRALVVDDEAETRQSAARALADAGFEVEAVDSAAAAEEALAKSPDVVLLELDLPDGSSYDLCETITSNHHIPAILHSSVAVSPADRVRGLQAGAYGFLVEPIDSSLLIATVDTVLRSRRLSDRLDLAISATGVGYWDWDIRTGHVSWAAGLEAMHGLEPGSFGGTLDDFMATIHTEDRPHVQSVIQEAFSGAEDSYEVGYRFVRRDGSVGHLAGRGRITRSASGEPLEITGVAVDVTASVRSAQRNESLLEYMGALMAATDPEDAASVVRGKGPGAAEASAVDIEWLPSDATLAPVMPTGLLANEAVRTIDPSAALTIVELEAEGCAHAAIVDVDTPSGSGRIAVGWSGGMPDDDHLRFAELFSRQSIWGVSQISDYVQQRSIALTLQRALQSELTIRVPGLEVASSYSPAADAALIGGDWFDVIPLDDDRVAFIVGDVVGHGIEAAAWSSAARHTIRTMLMTTDVDRALPMIDEVFTDGLDRFVSTMLLVEYSADRPCRIHSAGHPPPVVRRSDGTTELVDLHPGPPFGHGFWSSGTWIPAEVELAIDDTLVVYTDGAVERTVGSLDAGFAELLATVGPCEDLEELVEAVVALNEAPDAPSDDTIALAFARRDVPA